MDERDRRRIRRRERFGAAPRPDCARPASPGSTPTHHIQWKRSTTLLPQPRIALPALVFSAGIFGLAAGFFMQWYGAAVSYPLNIGGRPLASWPAFIPIAFEIAVLCAVASGFFGFFALARLPQPYQPIAALPGFERATQDRFFLIIDAADPRFDAARVVELIEEFSPCSVVPWRP